MKVKDCIFIMRIILNSILTKAQMVLVKCNLLTAEDKEPRMAFLRVFS